MTNSLELNGKGTKTANGHSRLGNLEIPAQKSSSTETSLRDVYRIFFRHKRKMLYFFAGTMVVAAVYGFLFPKTYRSEAKLFLRLGRENVGLDATTNLGQSASVAISPNREEEINTAVDVLKSRALLERVVDAIGASVVLDPHSKRETSSAKSQIESTDPQPSWLEREGFFTSISPKEKAVNLLRKQIVVEPVRKTNLIQVSHEGSDAEVSQQIISKLIDFYVDTHVRMNRTARAHDFLTQQASTLQTQLHGLENELRVLKNSTGLASPAEQRLTLVSQVGRLEDESKTTQVLIVATAAETKALRTHLASMSDTQLLTKAAGMPNVAADGMRQQLYTLQLKEKELASRMTDRNVELRVVREQLAEAKKVVDGLETTRVQTTTGPNRNTEELRLQLLRQESALASLNAKATTLSTQLASVKQQLETLNNNETRIAQLQREIQIRDANYRKYTDGVEQARIDESLERQRISNVNVAQPPTVSHQPVRPQGVMSLLAGLALGLVGAVGLAFGSEFVDHSLKTADDVESRLNVPVLVSIPQLRS